MSKNMIKKIFRRKSVNDQFVVPAGVTSLKISFVENFTIESGAFHPTMALDKFGTIWGWGPAPMGDNTNTLKQAPVGMASAASPSKKPFLRADGQVYNWGNNTYGQLGLGNTLSTSIVNIVPGLDNIKKVRRGETCLALNEAGYLYAWGKNDYGQVGDGTFAHKSVPTLVMSGIEDFWTDHDCYGVFAPNTVFARDTSGQTWAWGRDQGNYGALGTGVVGNSNTPALVQGGIKFKKISISPLAGLGSFAAGLAEDGNIYTWGYNGGGQLGDNTIAHKSTPVLVIGGYKFSDVNAGLESSIALTQDGKIYTWGFNTNGQLGTGNIFPRSSPVLVTGGFGLYENVASRIAMTVYSCYAITTSGTIYSWGFQDAISNLLGDNTTTKKSVPTIVFGAVMPQYWVKEILALDNDSVFTMSNRGIRYGWGNNASGKLAVNSATARFSAPQLCNTPSVPHQPTITGNIHWKMPGKERQEYVVSVVPGTSLTIAYLPNGMNIPQLALEGNQFTEQVEVEWVG